MNIFGHGMPLADAIDSPRLNVRQLGQIGDEILHEGLYYSFNFSSQSFLLCDHLFLNLNISLIRFKAMTAKLRGVQVV